MGKMSNAAADRKPHVSPIVKSFVQTSVGPIEVACFGNGAGDPVILIGHGLGGWTSLAQIALQLVENKPELRILAWSRPRFKLSAVNGQTTAAFEPLLYEANVVLPALMDAMQIGAAQFLAHSDGATVAMMFAGLFPERTLGVVALAPYGVADSYLRSALEALPIQEIDEQFPEIISVDDPQPALAYRTWRHQRISECHRNWSALALFAQISAPLVVVQGALDRFLSASQMNAIFSCILGPLNWITLRNAGHFLHLEVPEQITALVLLHLRSVGALPAKVTL